MNQLAPSITFDVKTILFLREEVKAKISDEEKRPINKLGSTELSLLKKKIEDTTRNIGISLVSERRLRNFLSDKITDQFKLPNIKAGNSIADAICIYLGYSGLAEYQFKNSSKIHRVKCHIEKSYSLLEPIMFDMEHEPPKIEYFTTYYLSYFDKIHPGVGILDHQTNQCKNYYGKLAIPGGLDIFAEEMLFTGPFEIDKNGYLTFIGTLHGFNQHFTMYTRAYYDDDRKNFRFIVGTYMGTSILEHNNIAGAVLFERASSFEEAKARWSRPIDERIIEYLKDKRVETIRRGFYSLEELLASN